MIYQYKIDQLKLMLQAEADKDNGGYGARLSHWHGNAKDITIEADAIKALIRYYERKDKTGK